ncbi:hypothetical protein XENTR_v10013876 [Xenopus tropicalis]|uniref:Microtubule-associated protein 10 n=1 Tax=Xenopus tropicalis TaxID=8364 RepID=A0A803J6M5_XENTR|nr:microtubule-associated protein 10 [Xenopus tropicalis]KAE8602078.1 hypothetical protein XENTR_v10013876 [Xenopus tropicalis]|eukprot:XP_017949760.1 PREDICTED: microtubule-associated protein 10 [Xenopus tropicalis]
MSSDYHSDPQSECLFCLEIFAYDVRLDTTYLEHRNNLVPALAFRLLDFPTLLLHPRRYENSPRDAGSDYQTDPSGVLCCTFGTGKSCLFQLSIVALHTLLARNPLYVLFLDSGPCRPSLLGSCTLSLSNAATAIKEEFKNSRKDRSAPFWRGCRVNHTLHDLMGRNIGTICLSYRLVCLGCERKGHMEQNVSQTDDPSLLECKQVHYANPPPIPQPPPSALPLRTSSSMTSENSCLRMKVATEETSATKSSYKEVVAQECNIVRDEHVQMSVATQTEQKSKGSLGIKLKCMVTDQEIIANVSCPPPLYYNKTCEKPIAERKMHGLSQDVAENPVLGNIPVVKQQMKASNNNMCNVFIQSQQLPDNVSVLSQLPLLNALFLELSVLNNQSTISRNNNFHSQLSLTSTNPASLEASRIGQKHIIDPVSKIHSGMLKITTKQVGTLKPQSYISPGPTKNKSVKDNVQAKSKVLKTNTTGKKKINHGFTNTSRLQLQKSNPRLSVFNEQRKQQRKNLPDMQQMKKWQSRCKVCNKATQSSLEYIHNEKNTISHKHRPLDKDTETLMQSIDLQESKIIFPPVSFHFKESENAVSAKQSFSDKQNHLLMQDNTYKPGDKDVEDQYSRLSRPDSDIHDQVHTSNAISIYSDNFDAELHNQYDLSSPEQRICVEPGNQDYTGYSDNFTSPDYTGRYSDTFESSSKTAALVINAISNSNTESYNQSSNSCSGASNPPSSGSSIKIPSIYKNELISTPLTSFDDLSSEYVGNCEQSYENRHFYSKDRGLLKEKNTSDGCNVSETTYTTQISPNMSNVELSKPENPRSNQQIYSVDNNNGSANIFDQYKHISELQANQLPGYTL